MRKGFDRVARSYLQWSAINPLHDRSVFVAKLLEQLAPGSLILELGCGAGIPATQAFARRCKVVGVDISREQLRLCREHVPAAALVQADMTQVAFPAACFDAVAVVLAITHVQRERHAALLESIHGWLRPGGWLLITMGARDNPDWYEPDWLGAPMVFSHFDAATNRRLVEQAGFDVGEHEILTIDEDGVPVPFYWVLALRPG